MGSDCGTHARKLVVVIVCGQKQWKSLEREKWLVVGLEEGHLGLWIMFHLSKSHMQTHEVELSVQYNRKFKPECTV